MAKWIENLGNGRYALRVSIGSGKSRRERQKTVTMQKGRAREKQEKLETMLDAMLQELSKNQETDSTVSQFFETWLELKSGRLAQKTFDAYVSRMERWVLPQIGDVRVAEVQPVQIIRLLNACSQHLSSRSVLDIYTTLRTFFNNAKKWGYIQTSPIDAVDRPIVEKREQRVIPESQIPLLVHKILELPLQRKCVLLLALFGGLRRGEICGLNRQDVHGEERYIIVERSYVDSSKGAILKSTKTNRSRRVSMPHMVIDALTELARTPHPLRVVRFDEPNRDALFTQADGRRLHPCTPTKWWGAFLAENPEFPKVILHGLRHTSGSILLSNGIDIETVSKRLGHAQSSTTLNIYSHLVSDKNDVINHVFEEISSAPCPRRIKKQPPGISRWLLLFLLLRHLALSRRNRSLFSLARALTQAPYSLAFCRPAFHFVQYESLPHPLLPNSPQDLE